MPVKKTQTSRSAGREVLEWVISLAVAVALALAVHAWVGQLVTVSGPSMQPGLYDYERVLVGKVEYYFRQPRLGDIVLTRFPNDTERHYIKRVIGVAGDHIAVTGGMLFVNGKQVTEPYIAGPMNADTEELIVPEGTVFVMGDNRNDSEDSRAVGPLPLSYIEGRAYAVLWPLDKIKKISDYTGQIAN